MKATIRIHGEPIHVAPVTLLGHNLEIAGDTAAGLLTERLASFRCESSPCAV